MTALPNNAVMFFKNGTIDNVHKKITICLDGVTIIRMKPLLQNAILNLDVITGSKNMQEKVYSPHHLVQNIIWQFESDVLIEILMPQSVYPANFVQFTFHIYVNR